MSKYVEYKTVAKEFEYLIDLYPTNNKLSLALNLSVSTANKIKLQHPRLKKETAQLIKDLYKKVIEEKVCKHELMRIHKIELAQQAIDKKGKAKEKAKRKKTKNKAWEKTCKREQVEKENQKYIKTLEIGKSYSVQVFSSRDSTVELEEIFGKVIKEYPHFYLLETPTYYQTVYKNDLRMAATQINERYR